MSRTAEDKAQDYTAMGHSVNLINGIIGGTKMADDTADEKNSTVLRNKKHLELMVAKDDWGDEDMTASNSAISAATSYLA